MKKIVGIAHANTRGPGTTYLSSRRQSQDDPTASGTCFNPSVSASAMRHSNHMYSFPKSNRNVFQTESKTSLRPSRDSSDALYDLPSTLSKEAALFGTESKENKLINQFKPGKDAPSPDTYCVSRLFDKVPTDSNRNSITPQRKRSTGDNTPIQSDRCTFGISHDYYRNTVIGSKHFIRPATDLSLKNSLSISKQSIFCDVPKMNDVGPAYNIKSCLKARRMSFGDSLDRTKFINLAAKSKEHVPGANQYQPQFNRTEMQRFRDIKIDRGAERMKPKVICHTILRYSTPNQAEPVMADSLLAQAKYLLASKENGETTPAPNAYTLPTFTDNLQMKIRFKLQSRPKKT